MRSGFIYRHVAGIDVFLDGAGTKVGEGVNLLFAGDRVREIDATPAPDVTESEDAARFRVLTAEALVRTKLVAFRRKDQVHLLDLIGGGLIDATWSARYPPELAARLQSLLDDPNG